MKNYTVIPTEAAEKLPLNDLYVFTALCLTAHDDNTTDVTYEQLAGFTGKSLGYIKDHFAKRLKNSGLCTIEEFVRNSNRRKRYILPYVPEQFRIIHRGVLTYIIHSGFISGYQNRYGDNLKPPTNVYHRMTA